MKKVFKILIIIAIFTGANLLAGPVEKERKIPLHPLDQKLDFKNRLAQNKPSVVLIGNSMLGEAVDPQLLSNLLDHRVEKLFQGGAASAWWYLVFKNIVLQASQKPSVTVIFFRDRFLTMPKYRTTRKYRDWLEGMAEINEPRLDRLVFESQGIERYLEKISLYKKREVFKNQIESRIKDIYTTKLTRTSSGEPQKAIDRIFDEKHLIPSLLSREQINAEQTEPTNDSVTFSDQVKASFLPDMIELADKNDTQLVFVRVKRRRDLPSSRESASLKSYMTQLMAYLDEKDTLFLDFTDNLQLQEKHYAKGDHLNKELGAPLFTKLLAEELKPVIQKNSISLLNR